MAKLSCFHLKGEIFVAYETSQCAKWKIRETDKLSRWQKFDAGNIWKCAWKFLKAAWKSFIILVNCQLLSDFVETMLLDYVARCCKIHEKNQNN